MRPPEGDDLCEIPAPDSEQEKGENCRLEFAGGQPEDSGDFSRWNWPGPPRAEDQRMGDLAQNQEEDFSHGVGDFDSTSGKASWSPYEEGLPTAELPEPEPPPTTILEGLLFVGDPSQPILAPERLAHILGIPSAAEVEELVGQLNARYERENRPYRIFRESGGYVLRLTGKYAGMAERLGRRVRESRLSQAALEVLAIVAYRQPITAEEVSRLRGRPSSHLLTQLLQKGLIQASPEPGKTRALQYRTTELFEEVFGLDSLEDLPQVSPWIEESGEGQRPDRYR
jgi:segregation and condensation protein B